MDSHIALGGEAPQCGGTAMAQDGSLPTHQDGRRPATLAADLGSPDGIDPTCQQVQPPRREPVFDRTDAQAEIEQLPSSDDAVLPPRQRPYLR